MSYLGVSRRIASSLVTRTNTRVPEDVLAYAVEVLVLNLLSVGVALLLAFLAGVLLETICCLGAVAMIRFFAGGAHSASATRCTLVTGLIFPLLGLVAQRITLLGPVLVAWSPATAGALGLVAVLVFAPVDSPAAPIISNQRRRRLKTGAIMTVALLSLIALALADSTLRASMSLGILWGAFILTPTAHRLFRFIDSLKLWRRGGVMG